MSYKISLKKRDGNSVLLEDLRFKDGECLGLRMMLILRCSPVLGMRRSLFIRFWKNLRANRSQDWIDMEQIIIRNFDALDWDYIKTQLKPLCDLKEDLEILPKLIKLREEIGESE